MLCHITLVICHITLVICSHGGEGWWLCCYNSGIAIDIWEGGFDAIDIWEGAIDIWEGG